MTEAQIQLLPPAYSPENKEMTPEHQARKEIVLE